MQRPKWLLKACVQMLLIQLFIFGSPHADELEELLNTDLATLMDMQIITPARKGQTVAQAPANVTVVTHEMIIRRGYQTLEDVLKDVPGFDFATGQPAGEYPTHFLFRGIGDLGQTKMLIMVDGIVRNDVSNGWARNIGYDFMLGDVDRIEIIAGPGSSLYGANAYAGLINIITRRANQGQEGLTVETTGLLGKHTTWSPEIFAKYRFQNGLSLQLSTRWYKSNGDAGINRPDPGNFFHNNSEPTQVLTTEYGNINNPSLPLPDGFRNNINDKYIRGRVEKGDFSLGFSFWDRDEGLGSEVVAYEYFANTPGLEYRAHHRGYAASAAYGFDFAPHIFTKSRAYFRNDRILPETGFFYTYQYQSVNNGIDPLVSDKKKGYHGEGFVAGIEQQLNIDLSPNSDLVLGFQLEQEIKEYFGISLGPEQNANSTIISNTFPTEIQSVQPVFFSQNAALYAQLETKLTSDVTFTGGLRYDADDEYGQVLNPRLALVHSPQKGLGVKLLYGQAFKSPTVFEYFDEWRGNADLEPEKIATGEAEISYRFAQKAILQAGIFYSRLTDLIVVAPNPDPNRIPIGPLGQYLDYFQNIGTTEIGGLTLNGEFQLNHNLYAYTNYAYTRGKDGSEIDNISQHKINLGINYLLANHLNINLRGNWRGKIKAPNSNLYYQPKNAATLTNIGYDYVTEPNPDGYLDSHLIFNLTLTGRNLPIQPQLLIRNLLDKNYLYMGRQSGSGTRPINQPVVQNPSGFIPPYHPQPGRELFFIFKYHFKS